MNSLYLLGPGQSFNTVAKKILQDKESKKLALQKVFPHCLTLHGIEPDFWTWQDPHGSIEGLQFILKNNQKLKKMKLLIPDYVVDTYSLFREYCGTTRINNEIKWAIYLELLKKAGEYVEVQVVPATTTKHIARRPFLNKDYAQKDLSDKDFYLRFMFEKVVYGTIEFDSDRIIGNKNKWGLENKLSSVMFPLGAFLKAKEVYPVGFDFIGSRFYDSNNSFGTWGNNVGTINEGMQIAIDAIKKWVTWSSLNNMYIKSVIKEDTWILNSVLEKL